MRKKKVKSECRDKDMRCLSACDSIRQTIRRSGLFLSTWGCKGQLMEDVIGMWCTMNEGYRAWGALIVCSAIEDWG